MKKDYFWNTIGVLAQNAISPLLLIIVTRLNGVYDSGIFSYAFSMALVFWAFSIWGGRTYQVSDLKREFTTYDYVMVRLLLGAGVLAASLLFCLLNGYDPVKSLIIITLVFVKVTESVADAVYGVLQINNRLYITGRSLLIKSILGVVGFAVVDMTTDNLLLAVVSLAVINILVFLFYDLRYARILGYQMLRMRDGLTTHVKGALTVIRRCSPIAAVVFLSMFSLNIPRYFLDMYHTNEIGYFGILVMPITVLALVITFLIQPKILHLSELFSQSKYDELNKTIWRMLLIVICCGLVGLALACVVGIPLFNFVFNLDFSPYKAAFLVVIIGATLNGIVSVLMNIFTIIRHFRSLFFTLIVTNIALVFLSMLFVDLYGLLGSVVLYSAVNLMQAVILVGSYRRIIKDYITNGYR